MNSYSDYRKMLGHWIGTVRIIRYIRNPLCFDPVNSGHVEICKLYIPVINFMSSINSKVLIVIVINYIILSPDIG